jgi:hypothetical protein
LPKFHKAIPLAPAVYSAASLKETRQELRRAAKTRFLADENIEPWALYILRYLKYDVIDCRHANISGRDDRDVFAAAWRLRRVLLSHDADYLDDNRFPFARCAGLVVFPTFPKQSWHYALLLQRTLNLIRKGDRLWLHTKIIVGRDFKVAVRTWNMREGLIGSFTMEGF